MGGAHLARLRGGARLLRAPRQWVPGLRGLHCGKEHPFRGLLSGAEGCGPQVRELGARWHRLERGTTYSALSVGTVLESPNLAVAERPHHWGQGLYHFTPWHKAQTRAVFPSSLVPAGSPRHLSCLVISPAGTPQPLLWPAGPAVLPDHLLGWEREGATNCTLETW